MAYELLSQRIAERLTALGLSERQACQMAGVGVNSIRHIRKRDHAPKIVTLTKLAEVLKVPASYLIDAAMNFQENENRTISTLLNITIRGVAEDNSWKETVEFSREEWLEITVPTDGRYVGVPRRGLVVRGPGMDKVYKDGAIVIVVRLSDIKRGPNPGERVVVYRRRTDGLCETTVREYNVDKQGRHILWPRSTDPDYQAPWFLDAPQLINRPEWDFPEVWASSQPPRDGLPDIVVEAVVIGHYVAE